MSKPASSAAPAANRGPARDDSDDDDSTPAASAGPYKTDPKGDALVAEADKKLKSFSLFGMGATQKQEDAKELLEKAAAQYKMNKNWSKHKAQAEGTQRRQRAATRRVRATAIEPTPPPPPLQIFCALVPLRVGLTQTGCSTCVLCIR